MESESSFVAVPPAEYSVQPYTAFEKRWFALCSGSLAEQEYNVMCVSWGMLGSLWGKPVAQVFVRPTRRSYQLLDRFDTFTLNALPDAMHKTLARIGSTTGREIDKFKEFGLTPLASPLVEAPYLAQAQRVFLCRRIYSGFVDPNRFEDPKIEGNYPNKDYHKFFVGEILQILDNTAENA